MFAYSRIYPIFYLTNDGVISPHPKTIGYIPGCLFGLASGAGREVDKHQSLWRPTSLPDYSLLQLILHPIDGFFGLGFVPWHNADSPLTVTVVSLIQKCLFRAHPDLFSKQVLMTRKQRTWRPWPAVQRMKYVTWGGFHFLQSPRTLRIK